MGFFRQEYWSGLPFPFLGDFPDPGVKPQSSALLADSLPLNHQSELGTVDYYNFGGCPFHLLYLCEKYKVLLEVISDSTLKTKFLLLLIGAFGSDDLRRGFGKIC